jgi:hypothetical protein
MRSAVWLALSKYAVGPRASAYEVDTSDEPAQRPASPEM